MVSQKVICRLLLTPTISTLWEPRCSIVQDDEGTSLIPGWSQFVISSGGISSMVTVAHTSSRNDFFSAEKLSMECILLAVVALLWTKFMRFSRECAQNRFSRTFPPNSSSLLLSNANKMPWAAAITIRAETAPPPPPPLTFLRYICTVASNSCPSKTGLPRFL